VQIDRGIKHLWCKSEDAVCKEMIYRVWQQRKSIDDEETQCSVSYTLVKKWMMHAS
jgi:hypothetical protein